MIEEERTCEEISKIARKWQMAKDIAEGIATLKYLESKESKLSVNIRYSSHDILFANDHKQDIAAMYKGVIERSLKTFKRVYGITYKEFLKQNKINNNEK